MPLMLEASNGFSRERAMACTSQKCISVCIWPQAAKLFLASLHLDYRHVLGEECTFATTWNPANGWGVLQ